MNTAQIFNDGMILQRDKSISVWGTGDQGALVSVEIQGHKAQNYVGADGKWSVTLEPLKVSKNETMRITDSKGQEILYKDIMVGDVWIAAGQSNMEFFMRWDKDLTTELSICKNDNIRFYDVPRVQCDEIGKMRDYSDFGFWRKCDEENLQYFSAVGYYFAKRINRDMDIPVGIIGCNCGGTRACCWMDEAYVKEYGDIWNRDYLDGLKDIRDYDEAFRKFIDNPMMDKSKPFADPLADRLMKGVSREELFATFAKMGNLGGDVIGPWHEWRPSGLYHTMLETIIPYTAAGVIYYQGESDDSHPDIYDQLLSGLIKNWRDEWQDQLPFIMTQLAPFGDGVAYPELREQQVKVAKNVKDVWLTSIGDVGHEYDIHPKEKQPVGTRLAMLALGHVYGKEILCDAPVVKECLKTSDKQVQIVFENTGKGLFLKDNTIRALQIFEEGNFDQQLRYVADVEKDRIIINIDDECEKLCIQFAKTPYYQVNIYNSAGIPAMPFQISI